MSKRTKNNSKSDVVISFALFDDRIGDDYLRVKFSDVPLQEVRPLTYQDYNPTGLTPLNDAVLGFIGVLNDSYKKNPNQIHIGLLGDESGSMEHLSEDVVDAFNTFVDDVKAGQNGKAEGYPGVLMVIMTDGFENASREDPRGDRVKKAIAAKEKEGWNFFYLGANQDAWSTGNQMGFGSHTHSHSYANTSSGVHMAMDVAAAAATTRSTSSGPDIYLKSVDNLAARNGPHDEVEEDEE